MNKPCPSCNRPAAGRFCSHCGATLTAESVCRECSAGIEPGARFCNACGAEASAAVSATEPETAGARGGASSAAWIVAAVAVVALLGVVLVPRFRADSPAPAAFSSVGGPAASAAPMPAPGGPQGINLSSMTPREAADRLFDRIMRTASQGDSAGARSFVPMALDAYALLDEMDADAHYHVGVLHLMNCDPVQARAAADEILAADPNHLFGLFTAAQAAQRVGNAEEARSLFRRFLDAYPTEVARELPEYTAHSPAFPEMRAEAQAAVSR
jgi:hypothetical protein